MDELQRLIVQEFGDRILGLGDPFQRNLWPSIYDGNVETAEQFLSEISVPEVNSIGNSQMHIIFEREGYHRENDVLLAARLLTHDTVALYDRFNLYLTTFHRIAGNSEDPNFLNRLIKNLIKFRLFGTSGAYLASGGEERFETVIPGSQLERLIRHGARHNINFQSPSLNVPSPIYVAICQIVKNAEGEIIVKMKEDDGYVSISVTDNGPGIRDIDGHPLPEDRLHEIFYRFTTKKEGGLGLQVVRRLAQLRSGYVNVTTKTEGNKPISYSTLFGPIPAEKFDGSSGTRFAIHYRV